MQVGDAAGASATRSAFPAASSMLAWSGVVTAPTVMVAMPDLRFLPQSAYGAWYHHRTPGAGTARSRPSSSDQVAASSFGVPSSTMRSSPEKARPGAQSVAEIHTLVSFQPGPHHRHTRNTCSGKRMRLPMLPPYASVRHLVSGEIELARRSPCAMCRCDLGPSRLRIPRRSYESFTIFFKIGARSSQHLRDAFVVRIGRAKSQPVATRADDPCAPAELVDPLAPRVAEAPSASSPSSGH